MNCLIIDNKTKAIDKLTALLKTFDIEYFVTSFDSIHEVPLEDFDFYILSGGNSNSSAKDDFVYFEELNLIKNTTKPLLGIGLGFHLICVAYGSTLEVRGERIESIIDIEITDQDRIFNKLSETLPVSEAHRWVVTNVSDELNVLAKSKYGIEIIKHKKRPVYGFQFHPELLPEKTMGDELFGNFLSYVKDFNGRGSLFTKLFKFNS